MVISRHCLNLEADLAHLKERLVESEASQKNLNRAVFKLNKEKRDALEELEKAKFDLSAKDGDIKAAVDTRDGAVKEMKHLMGQIKGAKAAAVSEYQASKAFEDNNLQFFYSGFKAFRKQAMERYPEIDFSAFQPYDDTKSVNGDGGTGNDGNQADNTTS